MTRTQTAKDVVESFLEAFKNKNVDDVLPYLDPKVVFKEAESLPYGGEWHGHDGFRRMLAIMMENYQHKRVESSVEPCGEDMALLRATIRFTSARSGSSVTIPVLELFTVRGGVIVEDHIFYFDCDKVVGLHQA